ncbi:hypothetical protein D3C78_1225510 [compost metagenome]
MVQVIDQPLIECTEPQGNFLRLWLKVLGVRRQVARAEQIMRKQFVVGISILKQLKQPIENFFPGRSSGHSTNDELGDGQAHLDLTRVERKLLCGFFKPLVTTVSQRLIRHLRTPAASGTP